MTEIRTSQTLNGCISKPEILPLKNPIKSKIDWIYLRITECIVLNVGNNCIEPDFSYSDGEEKEETKNRPIRRFYIVSEKVTS